MPESGPQFLLDVSKLDAFFACYERERRNGGLGASLFHVTPQQRLDMLEAVLGLNAARGWRRLDSETAETVFLRHIRPILAETRASGVALAAALAGGLPGAFSPPFSPAIASTPPEPLRTDGPLVGTSITPSTRAKRISASTRRIVARRSRSLWLAGLVLLAVCGLGGFFASGHGPGVVRALLPCQLGGECRAITLGLDVVPATAGPIAAPPPQPDRAPPVDDPDLQAYRDALLLVARAAVQLEDGFTPRALAAAVAGEARRVSSPALALAALLAADPSPPDQAITRSARNLLRVRFYAAAIAALERGLPRDRFDELANDESAVPAGDPAADALRLQFANQSAPALAAAPSAPAASWPGWTRWLPASALLLFLARLAVRLRGDLRAALRAAIAGRRGTPVRVDFGALAATLPPPNRALSRRLLQREPYPSRRLHGVRSVRATLRNGGFLTPVMRPASRAVEYVFLVARRAQGDQERERVLRIVSMLRRGGTLVTAYDCDPDPRTPVPVVAAPGVATRKLDLRALRELHPRARLVIVSDGRELVDYFTREPLSFVTRELRAWPRRMLLTPRPVGEWGEVEYNLALALDGMVGRATVQGFLDLADGLAWRSQVPAHRAAMARAQAAEPADGRAGRIAAWLAHAVEALQRDPTPARPPFLRSGASALLGDAPPDAEERETIVAGLRAWLGPDTFVWLCACALYPQLRFGVTHFLGLALRARNPDGSPGATIFHERALSRLTLLPWFEVGRMPPWLRRDLFAALEPSRQAEARAALNRLLSQDGTSGGLASRDGQALSLTIYRPDERGLDAPVDAVMADLVLDGRRRDLEPILGGKAFAAVFGQARRAVLRGTAASALVASAWAAAAIWLWPDPATAPHAPGAWLPLLLLVLMTALTFGAVAARDVFAITGGGVARG